MLVLSRKVGEKILIGNNISVTVVRVAQGVVRIGIEAPQNLAVVREELIDRAPAAAVQKSLSPADSESPPS
jgi:carbon storage regulator